MADDLSFLDQMQQDNAPSAAGQGQVDDLSFLDKIQPPVDESTGEPLAPRYDGLTPETPVNRSLISTADRVRMSFGNDEGNLQFLNQAYGEAVKNQEGDFVVKNKETGKWHLVDAKGFGAKDPWDLTKNIVKEGLSRAPIIGGFFEGARPEIKQEIAGDIADISKELGLTAATAVTAPATGSAAAIATGMAKMGLVGVGTETVNTVLGRAVGTYEATPEEQLRDVAFEGMLQAAGVPVAAAVKPTASWMGKNLLKFADNFNNLPTKTQRIYRGLFSTLSDIPEERMDMVLRSKSDAKQIAKIMSDVGRKASNPQEFKNIMVSNDISTTKQIAKQASESMSTMWKNFRDDIVGMARNNFRAEVDDVMAPIFRDAHKNGLIKFQNKLGKEITEEQVNKLMSLNDPRIANSITSRFATFDEYNQSAFSGENPLPQITEEAFEKLQEFYKNAWSRMSAAKKSGGAFVGKKGVRNMLDINKNLGQALRDLDEAAQEGALKSMKPLLANARGSLQTSIKDSLNKAGVPGVGLGDEFLKGNAAYSEAADQLAIFRNAHEKAKFSNAFTDEQWETLSKKLGSTLDKNVGVKNAMENLVGFLDKYDKPAAAKIRNASKAIQLNEAATAFNPMFPRSLAGKLGISGAAGAGAIGAAATGNPLLAGVAGVGAAAASPRIQFRLLNLSRSLPNPSQVGANTLGNLSQLLTTDSGTQALSTSLLRVLSQGKLENVKTKGKGKILSDGDILEKAIEAAARGEQLKQTLQGVIDGQ